MRVARQTRPLLAHISHVEQGRVARREPQTCDFFEECCEESGGDEVACGTSALACGDTGKAEALLRKAVEEIDKRELDREQMAKRLRSARSALGYVLMAKGKPDFERACDLFRGVLGEIAASRPNRSLPSWEMSEA